MILLNLIETHLSSWHKFIHNHWKEIWLLVNQCVGAKGHKKLLKLFTHKKPRGKLDWNRDKTVRGKRKVIYGVNCISYEKVILEYILTVQFSREYIHSVLLKHFYLRFKKCILGQITFQMTKFFIQKKIIGMYCAE